VKFFDHVDAGDPVEQARRYQEQGADELVFYDITASADGRTVDMAWVERVGRAIDKPFAVAGGLRSRDQARACLDAGADKISVNSPALERPELIDELAAAFGRQCVVLGVDSVARDGDWYVQQYTGRTETSREAGRRTLDWVREATARGAGEIVLNCMGCDGVRAGYDLAQTRAVVEAVTVPVIASGGAGAPEHFRDVFAAGVSGALAATVFHDRLISIPELKEYLAKCGIEMRR
jgi:cyclase